MISASPGGPAKKAGILPGDLLLSIDGKSTKDMDIYDAAEILQYVLVFCYSYNLSNWK